MKNTVTARAAAHTQREQQILSQALRMPMTPRWIFTLQGWQLRPRAGPGLVLQHPSHA